MRLLVVEDDQKLAHVLARGLRSDGYAVDVATDGMQAVQMATGNPPDIIFLDIRLPKMDGLGVLEVLRQDDRTRDIPVVILSNYSERELVDRGMEMGALDYLIKSQTTPARVAGGVANWLRN